MDQMVSRERDLEVDLESGVTTSEEEGSKDSVLGVRQAKKLSRVWSGVVSFNGSIKGEDGVSSCNNVSHSANVSVENAELSTAKAEGEEIVGLMDKKTVKEKRKKTSSKKPPRPPRGPSLDAADQKLIREISELAMLKRARIERMKAMKKMKAAKAASSNSNLCAMVITVLFCLVIIFQGTFSRGSSHVSFQGSPESTVVASDGLISVQYYKNLSDSGSNGYGSSSPNFIEQVSGLGSPGRRELDWQD